MIEITGLKEIPKQSVKIRLDNGDVVKISFYFKENQIAWFFDFEYKNFKAKGFQLTNCPNIIRQYKNILPFGIGCSVIDGYEAWFINDLSNGRAKVFILDEDDVKFIEDEVYEKI